MQDIYALVAHAFNHVPLQFANLPVYLFFVQRVYQKKKKAWMVKKMLDVIGIIKKIIFQS